MITANELRALSRYDPTTGLFVWLVSPNNRTPVGRIAGAVCSSGHLQIKVAGRAYSAHRLAVLYVTGEWPVEQVDHRNQIPGDNRWDNLRPATRVENARNKTRGKNIAGHRGVYWNKNVEKWQASIRLCGRNKSLGYYVDKQLAIAARLTAERQAYGAFSPAH